MFVIQIKIVANQNKIISSQNKKAQTIEKNWDSL